MKSATDWYGQTLVKHCGLLSVWTDKAAANARPFAELFRQVTPRRSRPGYPENTIKNKTMVRGFASIWGADRQDEALVKRPFLVRHQVSCQAGLHRRYQLESRSARTVNPFCQHGLGGPTYSLTPFPFRPPVIGPISGRGVTSALAASTAVLYASARLGALATPPEPFCRPDIASPTALAADFPVVARAPFPFSSPSTFRSLATSAAPMTPRANPAATILSPMQASQMQCPVGSFELIGSLKEYAYLLVPTPSLVTSHQSGWRNMASWGS